MLCSRKVIAAVSLLQIFYNGPLLQKLLQSVSRQLMAGRGDRCLRFDYTNGVGSLAEGMRASSA